MTQEEVRQERDRLLEKLWAAREALEKVSAEITALEKSCPHPDKYLVRSGFYDKYWFCPDCNTR